MILKKIIQNGAIDSIKIMFNFIELRLFDLKYKTDTHKRIAIDSLNVRSKNKIFASKYDPSPINPVRRIFKLYKPVENDIFIDIGSGKGLMLLIASDYCFKKIIGIEFSSELINISQKNILQYKKANNIALVEIDASLYNFTDETYFFLFNPFSQGVMEKVMINIIASYHQHPRTMTFVYNNPILEEFVLSFDFFDSYDKKKLMGRKFCILQKRNFELNT